MVNVAWFSRTSTSYTWYSYIPLGDLCSQDTDSQQHEASGHESQEGLAGAGSKERQKEPTGTKDEEDAPPDHYATLGISRRSSPEEYGLTLHYFEMS